MLCKYFCFFVLDYFSFEDYFAQKCFKCRFNHTWFAVSNMFLDVQVNVTVCKTAKKFVENVLM